MSQATLTPEETIVQLGFDLVAEAEPPSFYEYTVGGEKLNMWSTFGQPSHLLPDPTVSWPSPKEWADALRSGAYRQGRGALQGTTQDGPQFCCIGVLVDMAGVSATTLAPTSGTVANVNTFGEELLSVASYHFGLTQSAGGIPAAYLPGWMKPEEQQYFVELNDRHKMPFDFIADKIETMYPEPCLAH